jgi:hypothetical protein
MKNLIVLILALASINVYADNKTWVDADGYTCSIYKEPYFTNSTNYYSCHFCVNYSNLIKTKNDPNFGGDTTAIAWTKASCPSKSPGTFVITSQTLYDCSGNTFAPLFMGTSQNTKTVTPILQTTLENVKASQQLQRIPSDSWPAYFKKLACSYTQPNK